MEKKFDAKVIIETRKGKLEFSRQEIINFHSTGSVKSYCDIFELVLKDQEKKIRDLIEPKIEIEIWTGKEEESFQKIMAGYIDKIVTEKKENSDAVIRIYGRSYDAFLVDTKISGRIEFDEGYSQVIRMILKDTPFSEGKVDNSSGNGVIIFRNVSIIEIINDILQNTGWIFRLDYDKKYHFTKTFPKKSSHKIDAKDIKSYKIVKG